MNRRPHLVFVLTCAFSLLLCGATAALWIRGHWIYDDFRARTGPLYFEVISAQGCLHAELATAVPAAAALRGGGGWQTDIAMEDAAGPGFRGAYLQFHPPFDQLGIIAEADWHGFGFVRGEYDFLKDGEQISGYPTSPMFGLHVPAWLTAAFFTVLPVWFLTIHHRLRQRLGKHLCATCGYDLRATPDRCPECGSPAIGKPMESMAS